MEACVLIWTIISIALAPAQDIVGRHARPQLSESIHVRLNRVKTMVHVLIWKMVFTAIALQLDFLVQSAQLSLLERINVIQEPRVNLPTLARMTEFAQISMVISAACAVPDSLVQHVQSSAQMIVCHHHA
jgi:hypothetical protein